MTIKRLDLGAVLAVYTGIALPDSGGSNPVDPLYAVMNHVTGQSLMTHQLATLQEEVAAELMRQHPFLRGIRMPVKGSQSDEEWVADLSVWVADMKKVHGETIPVATKSDFRRVGPLDGIPADKEFIVVEAQ